MQCLSREYTTSVQASRASTFSPRLDSPHSLFNLIEQLLFFVNTFGFPLFASSNNNPTFVLIFHTLKIFLHWCGKIDFSCINVYAKYWMHANLRWIRSQLSHALSLLCHSIQYHWFYGPFLVQWSHLDYLDLVWFLCSQPQRNSVNHFWTITIY